MDGKSIVVWMTGLSAAGKTTIAKELKEKLSQKNYEVKLLDGDDVRKLWPQIGFTKKDREQNIYRVSLLARHNAGEMKIVIVSLISPYKESRKKAQQLIEEQGHRFIEIYIKCPLETCKNRDPKGLYARAYKGEIKNFTGIDDPYEEPENPDMVVETDKMTTEECVKKIISALF